jgi:BASS family bile acid:Na+ symporter
MPNPAILMPIALAIIMFGLGLSLTTADFARIARFPKAVVIALACQILVLPAITFGLVVLFGLPPLLAVGMMLIVAAPGGAIANVLSHLFGGDVALNISLTAINSLTAIVTIPVVVNLSLAFFDPTGGQIGLQFQKALEVAAMVLLPVVLGMIVRRLWSRFAEAMDRPVRIASLVILALVILATVLGNLQTLAANVGSLLLITTLVCAISLSVGFLVPRMFGVSRPQAISSALEIGLHNGAVALVIAQSVLQNPVIALPAAVYGAVSILLGFVAATIFRAVNRRADTTASSTPAAVSQA